MKATTEKDGGSNNGNVALLDSIYRQNMMHVSLRNA